MVSQMQPWNKQLNQQPMEAEMNRSNSSLPSVSFADYPPPERYSDHDRQYRSPSIPPRQERHRPSRRSMSIKHEQLLEQEEDEIMEPLKKENKVKMQTRRLFLKRNKGVWNRHHHLEYTMYVLFPLLIQVVCGWSWAFPDGPEPACNNEGMGGSSTKNTKICNLGLFLGDALSQFQVLVAFVLAGFVMSSVTLWRLRRTNYARLCGATRNILINISSLVPLSDDAETNQIRINMLRWVILAYELSVLKGRGCIDNESGREYLDNLNLLKWGEWDALVDGDRHTTAWWWIQMQAKELRRRGVISSDIDFHKICNAVTECRGEANDLMSVIDRDQPPPYTTVCSLLVNVNIFFFLFQKGVDWATWAFELGWGGIYSQPKMYLSIFVVHAYCAIFAMLFDLCFALHNPFGPRKTVDLPHGPIAAGLRKLAKELCESKLPPTFADKKSKRNVLCQNDYGMMDSTRGFLRERGFSRESLSNSTAATSIGSTSFSLSDNRSKSFLRHSDNGLLDSARGLSQESLSNRTGDTSLASSLVAEPHCIVTATGVDSPIPEEDPEEAILSPHSSQQLSFSVQDIGMFQKDSVEQGTQQEHTVSLSLNEITTYLESSASKLLEEEKDDDIGYIQV